MTSIASLATKVPAAPAEVIGIRSIIDVGLDASATALTDTMLVLKVVKSVAWHAQRTGAGVFMAILQLLVAPALTVNASVPLESWTLPLAHEDTVGPVVAANVCVRVVARATS